MTLGYSMTIEKVAFRDFIRGECVADILKLWDKKSNKSKGLYISPEYADEVLEMIDAKERERRKKRTTDILSFVGKLGSWDDATATEIRASKYL